MKTSYKRLGPRQIQVLTLLKDGKIHATNELPLPKEVYNPCNEWNYRTYPPRPFCYRHSWFVRCCDNGWVHWICVSGGVALWCITKKGEKIIKEYLDYQV